MNYVKFQRGSQNAYDRLKATNHLEDNALYFIYDENEPSNGGLLYLGKILIGNTTNSNNSISLSNLTDVNIDTSLVDGMILQYNQLNDNWEPIPFSTAIQNLGISTIKIYSTNLQENEEISDALLRINNNPNDGDISFIDNIPYIYNGKHWQNLIGASLDERIIQIENEISTIQETLTGLQNGFSSIDGRIEEMISNANILTYEIHQSLPEQNEVGNLVNTILLVPNEDNSINNQYDEYMVINGTYEKIGSLGIDLNDYITKQEFENTVGDLNELIGDLSDEFLPIITYKNEVGNLDDLLEATGKESTTIVEEVIELHDRLQWHKIINEN